MEVYYSVRTIFGTSVYVEFDEYMNTLRSARSCSIPYVIYVSHYHLMTFVRLFPDWTKFTNEIYDRL